MKISVSRGQGRSTWAPAAARLAGLAVLAFALPVVAQPAYPSKPVRIIVPWPAGGGTDFAGRVLAQRLGERMGQSCLVENRAGAAGNIGAEAVAKAAPDGYTLLLAITSVSINPALFAKMPFDIARDLAPVTLVARAPMVLAIHPEVPTMIEGGVKDFDFAEWYGLFVPSGTPREVLRRLNEESVAVLRTGDVRERFAVQGLEVLSSTPEQFGELVQRDLARFGDVIRRAGIKVE